MILGGGCGAQSGSVSAAKAPGVAKDRNASMCFGLGRSAPRLEEIVFALAVTAPLSDAKRRLCISAYSRRADQRVNDSEQGQASALVASPSTDGRSERLRRLRALAGDPTEGFAIARRRSGAQTMSLCAAAVLRRVSYFLAAVNDGAKLVVVDAEPLGSLADRQAFADDQADGAPVDRRFGAVYVIRMHERAARSVMRCCEGLGGAGSWAIT